MLRGFINVGFNVQVKLHTQPKPGVSYSARFSGPSAGPSEISLPDISLSFDHTNWNIPQNLTVSGHRFGTIPINYELTTNYTGKKKNSSFGVFIDDIVPNTVVANDAGYIGILDPTSGTPSFLVYGSSFTVYSVATDGIRPGVEFSYDSSTSGVGSSVWSFYYSGPDGVLRSGFPTVDTDGAYTIYLGAYPLAVDTYAPAGGILGVANVGITVRIRHPLTGVVMSHDSISGNVKCAINFNGGIGFNSMGSHINIDAGTAWSYSDTYIGTFCHSVQGPNVYTVSATTPPVFGFGGSGASPYVTGSVSLPDCSPGSTASITTNVDIPVPTSGHGGSTSVSFSGGQGGLQLQCSGVVFGSFGIGGPIYNMLTPAY